mgnify:FL=1
MSKSPVENTSDNAKSQFIEMFGDPVENDRGFPRTTIAGITKNILSGQCLNGEPRQLKPGEKAVLKVSAVTYGYFKANEYKVLQDDKQIIKGIYPHAGDLLFSRANTKEYVGATCLVDKDYPDLLLPDKLWKFVFTKDVIPAYMKAFLSMPRVRAELSELATGTSGSMYNISMAKLRNLPVIVPTIEEQARFVSFVESIDKSKFATALCHNQTVPVSLASSSSIPYQCHGGALDVQ